MLLHTEVFETGMEREVGDLHIGLSTLVKELLEHDAGASRPIRQVAQELQEVTTRIDEYWGEKLRDQEAKGEEDKAAKQSDREELAGQFRESFVASVTDAFADELDALRKDQSFQGSKEDMQTVVQMLEDGLACFPDQEVQSLWVEWERRGGSSKSSSSR